MDWRSKKQQYSEQRKYRKDLNVQFLVEKSFYIDEEDSAHFKEQSLKAVVPTEIKNEDIDILVLQTRAMEINDIKVNEAVLDNTKDLTEYKKEWFKKVESDSAKLFKIAQDALKANNSIEKMIIVKRLPRFDRSSNDILQIKS